MYKDIERYKGKYQIDENGNIKSLNYRGNTKREHILKPILRSGYLSVELYDFNGNRHKESIHRLVAESFIENPNNLPYVNHKDENKTNNNVENLEWCTPKYNSNYGTNPQRLSENAKAKPTWQNAVESNKIKVKQLSLNNELIKVWKSFADIAREFKIKNASNIVACCKGKKKTSYGYKWKYENIQD